MRRLNLVGQRFGRLVVKADAGAYLGNGSLWDCLCDCGTRIKVPAISLKRKRTSSCGCLWREWVVKPRKHGHSSTLTGLTGTYRSWKSAKSRCFLKTNQDYSDWGGRGITMCERWKNSFVAFLEDMGTRPKGQVFP